MVGAGGEEGAQHAGVVGRGAAAGGVAAVAYDGGSGAFEADADGFVEAG